MNKLNIAIVLGTIRKGRNSPQVGAWIKTLAEKKVTNQVEVEVNYEIVDLKEFDLPMLNGYSDVGVDNAWNRKMKEFDGYIFVTAEYNHSIPGVLKNALDFVKQNVENKAAAIVSYGSSGGVRAAEHLRAILAELSIATVRTNPALSIFNDFEDMSVFKPLPIHEETINQMLDQLILWGLAFKGIRK